MLKTIFFLLVLFTCRFFCGCISFSPFGIKHFHRVKQEEKDENGKLKTVTIFKGWELNACCDCPGKSKIITRDYYPSGLLKSEVIEKRKTGFYDRVIYHRERRWDENGKRTKVK